MDRVEFYASPHDLPIKRFQKFNKHVMIDTEVGVSFDDFEQRTHKAVAFLANGMIEDGLKELENRRQLVFNAFEEYSPKHYALALMVKKIDGVECKDMTEEGLSNILEKLNEIGYSEKKLNEDLAEVKKKSSKHWKCTSRNILNQMTNKILIYFLKTI